jgi:hypothetical protein
MRQSIPTERKRENAHARPAISSFVWSKLTLDGRFGVAGDNARRIAAEFGRRNAGPVDAHPAAVAVGSLKVVSLQFGRL